MDAVIGLKKIECLHFVGSDRITLQPFLIITIRNSKADYSLLADNFLQSVCMSMRNHQVPAAPDC